MGVVSRLGASLHMKGEVTGSEDLVIEGTFEGMVQLDQGKLTIGMAAKGTADIVGAEIVVFGNVKGNVRAKKQIKIKKDGSVTGDLITAEILIEDGAFFKGAIDIKDSKGDRTEVRRPMISAPMVGGSNAPASGPTLSANAVGQGSFLEPK